jgi:predicted dehydrogenase
MLRVGIVGAGAMAEYHASRFSRLEGVSVVAVCDHLPSKARAFAEARGLVAFTDPAEMAASGRVDAVAVASLDAWHSAPVLAALAMDLPVFCEKPLARTYREAEEMARAAATSGVPAVVNFSKRNGGLLSLARRIALSGELGEPRLLELSYRQSWLLQHAWGDYRTTPRWRWRLSEELSTHGALGDLGSHLIDAALLLSGGGLSAAACSALRFDAAGPGGLEGLEGGPSFESFEARLASPRLAATAAGGWREEGEMDAFRIRLSGDSGSLEIDLERSRSSLVVKSGNASREAQAEPMPSTYERFVAMASTGADPVAGESIDFGQGLSVQGLVEDCARLAGE